ncbi:c-type cytochrome [Marinithermus hydrothermalis]|uniref:Cytochrome c class I n=1 Tax=Marinithermus hydrothermalis (strain DSM 14884 / JCM 11576 / T1) TaxID=869210 RepID=F2NN01_MARHT|nr:cytochrome c [Marinithermus hydrothermalis]AEB12740.1 cytochrome c class I [Marinithermus hydrothermalis DSM 14884]
MRRSVWVLLWLALAGCAPLYPAAEPAAPEPDPILQGKALAARFGCTSCHSADGRPGIGPTWKGLYGSRRPLAGGGEAVADEAYLRESILRPNAKIVQGFPPNVMPQDFAQKLSTEQIEAILAYIRSLK